MSRINEGLYSSSAQDWLTPADFLEKLLKKIGVTRFDVDVACTKENVPAFLHYQGHKINSLTTTWDVFLGILKTVCWMNPPYGNELQKFVKKAHEESLNGNVGVWGLIPARPDTRYWKKHIFNQDCFVFFLRGRLTFGYGTEEAWRAAVVKRYDKLKAKWVKKHKRQPDPREDLNQIYLKAKHDIDTGTAPFPTALVYWGKDWREVAEQFMVDPPFEGSLCVTPGKESESCTIKPLSPISSKRSKRTTRSITPVSTAEVSAANITVAAG